MKINIFMATAGDIWEKDVLKAMAQGVQHWIDGQHQDCIPRDIVRIGRWDQYDLPDTAHCLEYISDETYRPCDVAIMFGSWKPREKGTHIARNVIVTQAKNFLCIETALLNRVTAGTNSHFRIGLNGFLNQDAIWPAHDSARGDTRLARLGIAWPGWQNNTDGHVVVALQLPGDASLRGADINDWAFRTVQQLREMTDRRIVVRCHPLASVRAFQDHLELAGRIVMSGIDNVTFSDGAEVSWADDLDGAWATVTYTSGLGIDSVLAGIPTVACDPGSFAWPISTNNPREIEMIQRASEHQVQTWLQQLSLCQWSLDEMSAGDAWIAYLPLIERNL